MSIQVNSPEDKSKIVAVGCLHLVGGISCRDHDLLDKPGEDVQVAGIWRWFRGDQRLFDHGIWTSGIICPVRGPDGRCGAYGELIQTDCCGVAEVHGRLPGIGWNLDKRVAVGEVLTSQAVLLRTEDHGNPPTAT